MIRSEVARAIEDIVASTMRRMGYRSLRIEESVSNAGEPALFVHVDYGPKGEPVAPGIAECPVAFRDRQRLRHDADAERAGRELQESPRRDRPHQNRRSGA